MSLSNIRKRSVAAHICKIAAKTIPRCGTAALVILCLGLYFSFPATKTFLHLQSEKNTPYEIIASSDSDYIDMDSLLKIDGVKNVSPIIQIDGEIVYEKYALNCKIMAVYSSYLDLTCTDGVIFPDNSNMPYLILNKAASEGFSNDEAEVTIDVEETVLLNSNGKERKAIICGIFDDESDSPIAYMSYNYAGKEYAQDVSTSLAFSLDNRGAAEKVYASLQRNGIYANSDSSISLTWELMGQQVWQTMILCISLLTCSVALIREKRKGELKERRDEQTALLSSGMTASEVNTVFPLRILLANIACIAISAIAAAIMNVFSDIALGICICLCCAHCAATIYSIHEES